MKYCLIFSREIFYVTIVLCLNILWLKSISGITARQTRITLCKHDVIEVCSIEYLTTHIELVLPAFNSWTVHKIIEYLTLGLLSSLWNTYHSTTAYFFDPPCIIAVRLGKQRGFTTTGTHMIHPRSHSVTCHPAEVTFPPSPQPKLVIDLATPKGCKAELTYAMQ